MDSKIGSKVHGTFLYMILLSVGPFNGFEGVLIQENWLKNWVLCEISR